MKLLLVLFFILESTFLIFCIYTNSLNSYLGHILGLLIGGITVFILSKLFR